MQSRSFLGLLFLILFSCGARAQHSGDLSLHYRAEQGMELEFWLHTSYDLEYLDLALYQAEVLEVRLSQGRLKQALEYEYSDDLLRIYLLPDMDPRSRIYIHYRYEQASLEASPFLELLKPGFIFNAFNLEEGQLSGVPGWLIPSYKGTYDKLRLGLQYPEGLKPGLPLEEDYEVDLGDSEQLSYYLSEEPVDLRAFYLVLGQFRRFDPEDVLEDLAENEERLQSLKISQFEQKFQSELNFLSVSNDLLLDESYLVQLEALEKAALPQTFLRAALPEPIAKQERAYALFLNTFSSPQEAKEQWHYYWQGKLGQKSWQEALQGGLSAGDRTAFFWRIYLEAQMAQQGLAWSDTAGATLNESERDYLNLVEAVFEKREPLQLELSYRFKARANQLELYLAQADTNLNLNGSLSGRIILRDSTQAFRVRYQLGVADTLSLDLKESPRSIYFESENPALLQLNEERPTNYWLYDLSKAPQADQRRRALVSLLEQGNANLLATVIGVALDSGEEELQLLALSKVKELNANGRERLKSTFEALAADQANVKLMQKAQAILVDYWSE